MEKFKFNSEEEKRIYKQLLDPKEAVLEAFEKNEMEFIREQLAKTDRMLGELANQYSLAVYDLEEPSRMKRLSGRVAGKLLKLFFMGPFAQKQIAYNKQVLIMLAELRQMQEGLMEAVMDGQKKQEESE